MAAHTLSPAYPVTEPVQYDRPSASGWRDGAFIRRPVAERVAKEDLKWYLLNKYRVLFIDRISRDDLEELKYYLRQQYDPKTGWKREYTQRFVVKMGEYLQEEILRSEIAGIASLLALMKPEDLRDGAGSVPRPEAGSGIRTGMSMPTGRYDRRNP